MPKIIGRDRNFPEINEYIDVAFSAHGDGKRGTVAE